MIVRSLVYYMDPYDINMTLDQVFTFPQTLICQCLAEFSLLAKLDEPNRTLKLLRVSLELSTPRLDFHLFVPVLH